MTMPTQPVSALTVFRDDVDERVAVAPPPTPAPKNKRPKYRVLRRGEYYQVQVRWLGIFWRALQTNGYMQPFMEWNLLGTRDNAIDFPASLLSNLYKGEYHPDTIIKLHREREEMAKAARERARFRSVDYIE